MLVEAVGAVEHEADVVADGRVEGVQALVFEVDAAGAVGAVDVAEGGREPVDARGGEVARLGRRRHDGFQLRGILDAVLPALDATRLRLARDAPLVTKLHQLFRFL